MARKRRKIPASFIGVVFTTLVVFFGISVLFYHSFDPRSQAIGALACNAVCNADTDCTTGYCYQPPMPPCTGDFACIQVMPKKVCRNRICSKDNTCGCPSSVPKKVSTMTVTKTTSAPFSWQHASSGSNTMLVVSFSYRSAGGSASNTVSKVTYGEASPLQLTKIRRDIGGEYATELWYVVNPPAGTHTVSVQFTGSADSIVASASTYEGVGQTDPIKVNDVSKKIEGVGASVGTGTTKYPKSFAVSIPTNPSDLVAGVATTYTGNGNTVWPSNLQTETYNTKINNVIGLGALLYPPQDRVQLSWTSSVGWPWAGSAISIKPSYGTNHTIKLVNHPLSANQNAFALDAVEILGTKQDDTTATFTYTGSWTKVTSTKAFGGGYAMTSDPNGAVTFQASAEKIKFRLKRGNTLGSFDVYVDGVLRQNITSYRSIDEWQAPVTLPLDPRPYTITAETKPLRVIEVRYFPKGRTDVIYNPDTLSLSLQTALSKASAFQKFKNTQAKPVIDVEVVQIYDRLTARPNTDGNWGTTYKAILAQDNLCEKIKSYDIDQIWLWVDPREGYDPNPGVEYAISSKYFQSGVQYATVATPTLCGDSTPFVMMGFDDTRTYDLAQHSFGHLLEGMLGNLQSVELFWYRFAGNTAQGFPLTQRCGNVHFPPNGIQDYDYGNTSYVDSSCEAWNPDVTGTKQHFNCTKWGCNQAGYLDWWMQNMPSFDNTIQYQGKKLPPWFDFTVHIDDAISAYAKSGTYYMNQSFLNGKL